MRTKDSGGINLLALAALLVGVLLLLNSFLLFTGFNILALWPLLLVVAGVQMLLQGDLGSGASARTFGITRGTVQSGTLEVSAGEIDVHVRDLVREGRLAAGQYAPESRPALDVRDTHTALRMDRGATPWFAFGDWEIALARDLPWQIYVSTNLGQVDADLTSVIVQQSIIATGIGDIRFVAPREAFEPIALRSALGDIHLVTPPGVRAVVHVQRSRMLGLHVDERRYRSTGESSFEARDAEMSYPLVEVLVSGTFGEVYLA